MPACTKYLSAIFILLISLPLMANELTALTDNSAKNNVFNLFPNQYSINPHENIAAASVIQHLNTLALNEQLIKPSPTLTANTPAVQVTKYQFEQVLFSSAQYQYGRFTATTGFITDTSSANSNSLFYLQSSLLVLTYDKFNLTIAAGINEQNTLAVKYNNEQSTSFTRSSLGVVGSYAINKKWQVTGALTASTNSLNPLNTNETNAPTSQAMIGTSYAF